VLVFDTFTIAVDARTESEPFVINTSPGMMSCPARTSTEYESTVNPEVMTTLEIEDTTERVPL
jgi:hypothetical protein